MAKRYVHQFAIIRPNCTEDAVVAKFHTIEECVKWGQSNDYALSLDRHMIEDRGEDIEIDIEELLEAWAQGERPLDLTMF